MDDMILNAEDFNKFTKACRYWQDRFSLNDWEMHFVFGMPTEDSDSIGTSGIDYESRRVVVYLNALIDSDDKTIPRDELIELTAQHEVLEVLLASMQILAQRRVWDLVAYNSEVHAVIHRISKALRESAKDVLRQAMEIKKERK